NGRSVPYGVPLPFKTGSVLSFGVLSFRFLDAAHLHRIIRRGDSKASGTARLPAAVPDGDDRTPPPPDEDLSQFGFVVRCEPLAAPEDEAIAGSLGTAPLSELLLGIERTARSGAIRIRTGDASGEIVFSSGAPYRARFGDEAGVPALGAMLALAGGTFVLWP